MKRHCDNIRDVKLFVVIFQNKDKNEEIISVVDNEYEDISYGFMKYSCEYKDITEQCLENGWNFIKQEKYLNIKW
jgi:hypothetical protein